MNGYEKIEEELRLADLLCHDNIIATIRCGNIINNCLLAYYGDIDAWEWEYDWWEGEKDVELIGAVYLSDVYTTENKLRYKS